MTQQQIVNGMDLGKLEAFRTAIQESPVKLGLEARGIWASGKGTRGAARRILDRMSSEGS